MCILEFFFFNGNNSDTLINGKDFVDTLEEVEDIALDAMLNNEGKNFI